MPDLTVGMAVYDDFDGVWFTIQALRLYQDLTDVELLVVDNYGCDTTRDFLQGWTDVRYIRSTDVQGTAAPRDLVFREATGEAVLCCDSHVLFVPGTIARLRAYYAAHPDSMDLLQGPLVSDDLTTLSTHFTPGWRGQMWGTWDLDPRGLDPDGEPFEIPMQGLGAFSCRREAWVGFNPRFRGFGGEEGYLHEKFRQAGRRTLCLPWLRWNHRFARPKGMPYQNTYADRLRNYLVGHAELGLDPVPALQHFSEVLDPGTIRRVATEAFWPEAGIEEAYRTAADRGSDINEHVPTLRALAQHCGHVTELGTRGGVSTTALVRGGRGTVVTYDLVHDPSLDRLVSLAADSGVILRPVVADVLAVDIEETDLLFIDTFHTAAQLGAELGRHAEKARRWIALHDTETFGEHGEDGGPGLLPAVHRFLADRPGWSVVYHTPANNGFTVLAREPGDMVPLPEGAPVPVPFGPTQAPEAVGRAADGPGTDGTLPFLVAVCPTYGRRRLVENAVACFLAQSYPPERRRLLVLDDLGDLGDREEAEWAVVSRSERLPSLPAKYTALAELALARWPQADALVVWEDDDVYLPDHLLAHAGALATAGWSKPSRVLSTHSGTLQEEPADGRFFASIAVRVDALQDAGGFVEGGRGDVDQQTMARLRAVAGPPGDPTLAGPPTYVFRWADTGAVHGQTLMRGPDDETWYERAGRSVPAAVPAAALVPALDPGALEIFSQKASPDGSSRSTLISSGGPVGGRL